MNAALLNSSGSEVAAWAAAAGPGAVRLQATIVLPVFNEQAAIGNTLKELARRGLHESCEILVVDDGSTDNTADIVRGFNGVRLLRHPVNRGYGAALKTGARAARCEKLVFMDGDGQHSPEKIEEVIELLDTNALVIGERGRDSRQERSRLLGKRLVRLLGEYLLAQKLPDFNSGFRGFQRRALLPILALLPNGFSFSTTSTLAFIKNGHAVATLPIHVQPRIGRPSSVRFFRDGLKTALLMMRLVMLFNPLRIFIPASLLFGFLGVLWGVTGYLSVRRVPNSAVLTVVLGMFLFFVGLLADQIAMLHASLQETEKHQ